MMTCRGWKCPCPKYMDGPTSKNGYLTCGACGHSKNTHQTKEK